MLGLISEFREKLEGEALRAFDKLVPKGECLERASSEILKGFNDDAVAAYNKFIEELLRQSPHFAK